MKFFVLTQNTSFTVQDIDQGFWSLIQSENLVFTTESWTSDTGWQTWTTVAGQPVSVSAGASVTLSHPRSPQHAFSTQLPLSGARDRRRVTTMCQRSGRQQQRGGLPQSRRKKL